MTRAATRSSPTCPYQGLLLLTMTLDQVTEMDSITALTSIPDQSVAAVITDPPYHNGKGNLVLDVVDGLAALYVACKKAMRHVVFFWRATDVPRPPPGWYETARHIWYKTDSNSRLPYEAIVVWSRDRKYERCRVWSIPILSLRTLADWEQNQPTRKPLQLLRYLVQAYTREGETILDPFAGSGTTLVACKQLKRHFIGFEKNPEFAAMARARLEPPRPPEQTTVEETTTRSTPDGEER